MSRASPVLPPGQGGEDPDAMMLLIPGSLWKVLTLQAQAERRSPGDVLSAAVKEYLERKGTKEAVDYLWSMSRILQAPAENRGQGG